MRLLEGKYDYGCVMARIDEEAARKLLEFNLRTIAEELLYEEEGHEYGREKTPHITLKYGLVQSYSPDEMKKILRNVTPFDVEVKGISVFENEKFDVVKFDVDGKDLRKINEILSMLPNHDEHPVYQPHMTMAYVKKGNGRRFAKTPGKYARVPVRMIEYSDRGVKSYYHLDEAKVPSMLYHGTSEDLANRAWKKGLIPGGDISNPKINHPGFDYYLHGVYLTTNPEVAAGFGEKAGRDTVILSIDPKKLDIKKLKKDKAAVDSFVYLGTIPPDAIVDWMPLNPPSV